MKRHSNIGLAGRIDYAVDVLTFLERAAQAVVGASGNERCLIRFQRVLEQQADDLDDVSSMLSASGDAKAA